MAFWELMNIDPTQKPTSKQPKKQSPKAKTYAIYKLYFGDYTKGGKSYNFQDFRDDIKEARNHGLDISSKLAHAMRMMAKHGEEWFNEDGTLKDGLSRRKAKRAKKFLNRTTKFYSTFKPKMRKKVSPEQTQAKWALSNFLINGYDTAAASLYATIADYNGLANLWGGNDVAGVKAGGTYGLKASAAEQAFYNKLTAPQKRAYLALREKWISSGLINPAPGQSVAELAAVDNTDMYKYVRDNIHNWYNVFYGNNGYVDEYNIAHPIVDDAAKEVYQLYGITPLIAGSGSWKPESVVRELFTIVAPTNKSGRKNSGNTVGNSGESNSSGNTGETSEKKSKTENTTKAFSWNDTSAIDNSKKKIWGRELLKIFNEKGISATASWDKDGNGYVKLNDGTIFKGERTSDGKVKYTNVNDPSKSSVYKNGGSMLIAKHQNGKTLKQIIDENTKKKEASSKPKFKTHPNYTNPYLRISNITEGTNGMYTFEAIPLLTYNGITGEVFYNGKHIGQIGGGDSGGYISHANFDFYNDSGLRFRIYSNGTMALYDPKALVAEWDDISNSQRDKYLLSLTINPKSRSNMTWRWFKNNEIAWKKQGGNMEYKNYFKDGGRFIPKAQWGKPLNEWDSSSLAELATQSGFNDDAAIGKFIRESGGQGNLDDFYKNYFLHGAGKDAFTKANLAYENAMTTPTENYNSAITLGNALYTGGRSGRKTRRTAVLDVFSRLATGAADDATLNSAKMLFGENFNKENLLNVGIKAAQRIAKARFKDTNGNASSLYDLDAKKAYELAEQSAQTLAFNAMHPAVQEELEVELASPSPSNAIKLSDAAWDPGNEYAQYKDGSWNRLFEGNSAKEFQKKAWEHNNLMMLRKKLGNDHIAGFANEQTMLDLLKDLGLQPGTNADQADGKFGKNTWNAKGWGGLDFTIDDNGLLSWKSNSTAFKQGGKMTNKYQLGGAAPQQQDMETLVAQLVQAAMAGDEKATQTINKIMEAAKAGDQQAVQIALMIQLIAQLMQGLQAPAAKHGAKLAYIHELASGCPAGTEAKYFKKGGHLCKACVEKAKKAKCGTKAEQGAELDKCGGKAKKKYFEGGVTDVKSDKNSLKKAETSVKKNAKGGVLDQLRALFTARG